MIRFIPEELKHLNNWCVWKSEKRGDNYTKIPYNARSGFNASSTDPSTWSSYEAASRALSEENYNGLGFFFTEPYVGVDLDNISTDLDRYRAGDTVDNMLSEFMNALKTYTEISPSGKGVHLIFKGKKPGKASRRGNVEMYDSGRFFTMTGRSIGKFEQIGEPSEKAVERLYRKYIQPERQAAVLPMRREHGLQGHDLSESEVIHRALGSAQGVAFKKLLDGKWEEDYTSQSEADMAFANMLAFWCAHDFGQMDSIYRQSGLMRDKWDRKTGATTYGEATLNKAINETSSAYNPAREKRQPLKYIFGEEFGGDTSSTEQREHPVRSYDDMGNADRFIDRYGEFVRYVYAHKKYYVYNASNWQLDDMGNVRKLIDGMVESMKHEPVISDELMDEEDAIKAQQKHLKYTRGTPAKDRLKKELQHRLAMRADDFDQDDMLLNVTNGYLDLSDGKLCPHDKDKYFSMITSTEFTDNAQPEMWLKFLDDIFDGDQELIDYIQRAVGYTMTGSTKEQGLFILHGIGRNGKSLFVDTLAQILGDYSKNIRAESLMAKSAGQATIGNDIARLQGARMVTSSEPTEGFRFDEGLIKSLTGEDSVTARFLYGEDFEFKPKFKIWLTTNHKPIIRGTDDGIWRRMNLIPFDVQIPPHKVDKDLGHKLMREAPAIMNWMLEGCRKWQREGLNPPQRITEARKTYRSEMDVVEYFVQENCIVGEEYEESFKQLFKAYQSWAQSAGEYKMGQRKFGMKMKEKYTHVKRNYGAVYQGLKLANPQDPRFNFVK